MKIDASSRILLFAPHPDDEALAAAGLLQRAAKAGAMARVVFATDGENNPWPHRLIEWRWRIDTRARKLWATRRMGEALASLRTLGVAFESVDFLHWPDQRITELLMFDRGRSIGRLAQLIEETEANVVVAPSLFDLHPDHSALHLLVRAALARAALPAAEQLYYVVHTRGYHSHWNLIAFQLASAEQETKRRAILCHRTQIALSRKRFLAHARPTEQFWRPTAPRKIDPQHPIHNGQIDDGGLLLQLRRRKRSGSAGACALLLAMETESGGGQVWSIPLPRTNGSAKISDATGTVIGLAQVQIRGTHAQITIPLELVTAATSLFAKLKEPTVFFDAAGWRELVPSDSPVDYAECIDAASASPLPLAAR